MTYPTKFEYELRQLINKHSRETDSGTPDFILAEYLNHVLWAYNKAVIDRASWRGETVKLEIPLDRQ